jgi:hypothetical protein
MIGMKKRMKNSINITPQVGFLQRPSFLSQSLRLPKKLDLWRTPLPKSVATLAKMSFFPIHMLQILH